MKRIIAFILFLPLAVTAFAAENPVNVAIIDKGLQLQQQGPAVPPKVTEAYRYYEVKGGNERELRCQMTQNGCTWKDGKKYDSVTSWHVNWDYSHVRTAQSCNTDAFKATVEITFNYPKWVSNNSAPQPLLEKWTTYMKNLVSHENGHRDMAIEAAADLTRAVAALPAAATCAELDREVHTLCSERMKKLNADERKYDEVTHHGVTQGALFP